LTVIDEITDGYEVFDWSLSEEVKAEVTAEILTEVGAEVGVDEFGIVAKATTNVAVKEAVTAGTNIGSTQHWTRYPDGHSSTIDNGWESATTIDTEASVVRTLIADRITTSTGVATSATQSWSTTDSFTVSKTYEAGYFNASGAPLQWKIVKYTVRMPMFYRVQYLIDDEWITSASGYILLNTVQGTCRAWLENNTAYYEHWGTGEPVTWNEFWGTFFTKESLIAAYQNKLYPDL
jgi:hypothetical protein